MLGNYFLLTLTFILPVACALLCYLVNNIKICSLIGRITSFVLLVSIVIIIQQLANSRGKIAIIVMNPPFNINRIIGLVSILLPTYFIYVGIKIKKIPVCVLAVLQILAMILFEVFSDIKNPVITVTASYMSASIMFLFATVLTFVVFLIARYMDLLEKKLGIKGRAQAAFISLIFIFSGVLNSMVTSDNILWLYPFWGVTTLCTYLLVLHVSGKMDDVNAVQLLYLNLIGSTLFIIAIILVYKTYGVLALGDISKSMPYGRLLGLLPPSMALISFAGFIRVVFLKLNENK
ncbi:MAG TPA: hypothetical protein GXX36_14900 [Clostridiaceae bacterium]|nr:hypothetical protein [Clostridiaceae bacterium]